MDLKKEMICINILNNYLIKGEICHISLKISKSASIYVAKQVLNPLFFVVWRVFMFGYSLSRISADRILNLLSFIIICIFFGVSAPVCFYSCADTGAVVQPPEKNLFESEDYVIYLLSEVESAADLTERFLGDKKESRVIEEANPGVTFKIGKSVVIPLKNRNKGELSAEEFQTIPILAYNRFAEDCNSPLCMPTRIFELQMRYLKENGYHVVTPEELLAFLEYSQGFPKKSVLITIDDGYRSAYDIAYPVLEKKGFTTTLFNSTSFIGT
jgi:hypothetical protein